MVAAFVYGDNTTSSSTTEIHVVVIPGFVPVKDALTLAELIVEEINNRTDVFPNHKLVLHKLPATGVSRNVPHIPKM